MSRERGWSVEFDEWVYGEKIDETTLLNTYGEYEEIVEGSIGTRTYFTDHRGDAIYVGDEGYILFPTTASNPMFVGDDGISSAYVKFVETDAGFDAAVRWKNDDVSDYLGLDAIRAELEDSGRKFRFVLRHTAYELLNKVYTVSLTVRTSDVFEVDGEERARDIGTETSEFDLRGYDWNVETVYRRVVDTLIDRSVPVYVEDGTTKLYAVNETMLSLTDKDDVHYTIILGCRRDDDREMEEYERSGIDHWFDLNFDDYANGESTLW